MAWGAHALADTNIQLVSYSTGRNGSALKWLPKSQPEAAGVQQAAAAEPIAAPKPAAEAKVENPPPRLNDGLLEKPVPPPNPAVAAPNPLVAAPNPLVAAPKPRPQMPTLDVAAAPRDVDCNSFQPPRPLRDTNIFDEVLPATTEVPPWCAMKREIFAPRSWEPITFTWKATALCHKPAYFEDVQLERYGHMWGPHLQPLMSAGHFFLAVPAMPYFMALYPPNECVYTLGYYRPGSCAPYMLDPLPLSLRAALAEGGVWTGMIFLIP